MKPHRNEIDIEQYDVFFSKPLKPQYAQLQGSVDNYLSFDSIKTRLLLQKVME